MEFLHSVWLHTAWKKDHKIWFLLIHSLATALASCADSHCYIYIKYIRNMKQVNKTTTKSKKAFSDLKTYFLLYVNISKHIPRFLFQNKMNFKKKLHIFPVLVQIILTLLIKCHQQNIFNWTENKILCFHAVTILFCQKLLPCSGEKKQRHMHISHCVGSDTSQIRIFVATQ